MCHLLRSKRKIGFPVQVSNGIFEYYPELRDSLWLLAILIDLTTEEKNGEQKVHGGAPICDTCLAAVFRCSRKTIVRWRQKLLNFKPFPLIKAKRTPVGYSYTVLKFSKKTFKSDGTNLSHHTHNTPSSDVPKRDNSCTDHVPTDVPKRDNHIEKTGTVQNRTDAELDYTLPSEKNSNPSVTFTTPPAPSVDTSIQTARDTFKRKFGRDPLPEVRMASTQAGLKPSWSTGTRWFRRHWTSGSVTRRPRNTFGARRVRTVRSRASASS